VKVEYDPDDRELRFMHPAKERLDAIRGVAVNHVDDGGGVGAHPADRNLGGLCLTSSQPWRPELNYLSPVKFYPPNNSSGVTGQ